jgi:hypothetical protein
MTGLSKMADTVAKMTDHYSSNVAKMIKNSSRFIKMA